MRWQGSCRLLTLLVVLSVLHGAAAQSLQAVQAFAERALSPENLHAYRFELLALCGVLMYLLHYLRGCAAIRKQARTWVSCLWHPQGVLVRNFVSHPGTLEPGNRAWKESNTQYRSFASGRRYCQYALLTLDFKAQQDLFSQIWYMFQPRPDLLSVDVIMNDMPPTVLALGTPKGLKDLLKEQPGIKDYAKTMSVAKDRANGWSDAARGWSVLAESPSVLYELLNTEPAIARAFTSKLFRSALISSEDTSGNEPGSDSNSNSSAAAAAAGGASGEAGGSSGSSGAAAKAPRQQLRFVFALPPAGQEEELEPLLAAVFLLVDLVGSYKVSPEMRKKAQELRTKLEQEAVKKISQSRQGVLAQKRSERLEAERARARAAGPQALAKFEERLQRQMQKRDMRKRTVKM